MHNNLSVYSLNSRAEKIWEGIEFRVKAKEVGFLGGLAGRFGRRLIGKGAEYTPEIGSLRVLCGLDAILGVCTEFGRGGRV